MSDEPETHETAPEDAWDVGNYVQEEPDAEGMDLVEGNEEFLDDLPEEVA